MAWGEDASMALGVYRVAYSTHQGYEGMPFYEETTLTQHSGVMKAW